MPALTWVERHGLVTRRGYGGVDQVDAEAVITTAPARRPLMDVPTVAKYLGVTERHVRRLVRERRIPFVKSGRPLRFDPDEIDA